MLYYSTVQMSERKSRLCTLVFQNSNPIHREYSWNAINSYVKEFEIWWDFDCLFWFTLFPVWFIENHNCFSVFNYAWHERRQSCISWIYPKQRDIKSNHKRILFFCSFCSISVLFQFHNRYAYFICIQVIYYDIQFISTFHLIWNVNLFLL